jgi:hypothetical protein
MGPFLADCVPTRAAFWLFGIALATSVVSLATLGSSDPAPHHPRGFHGKYRGCKAKAAKPTKQKTYHHPRLMIGPMTDAGTYRDVMRDTVKASLEKTNHWSLELVDAPPATGYFLDGTVDEFKVERVGDASYVTCELQLWVRAPSKVVSNLVSGTARVKTTLAQRDVALSRQACVTTVAEELVERLFAERVE